MAIITRLSGTKKNPVNDLEMVKKPPELELRVQLIWNRWPTIVFYSHTLGCGYSQKGVGCVYRRNQNAWLQKLQFVKLMSKQFEQHCVANIISWTKCTMTLEYSLFKQYLYNHKISRGRIREVDIFSLFFMKNSFTVSFHNHLKKVLESIYSYTFEWFLE